MKTFVYHEVILATENQSEVEIFLPEILTKWTTKDPDEHSLQQPAWESQKDFKWRVTISYNLTCTCHNVRFCWHPVALEETNKTSGSFVNSTQNLKYWWGEEREVNQWISLAPASITVNIMDLMLQSQTLQIFCNHVHLLLWVYPHVI